MNNHLTAPKFPGFDPDRKTSRRVVMPEAKRSLGRRVIDKILPALNQPPVNYNPPVSVNGFVTNRVASAAQEQVYLTPYVPAAEAIIAARQALRQADSESC